MARLNVLLTGASGDIGFRVFKILLKKTDKFRLKIFVRGSKKNKKMFKPYLHKVKVIWGDILDKDKVKMAVDNQDIILHLAAIIPPKAYENPSHTYDVNVEGTKSLINEIKRQDHFSKIIYPSTIAVYGDRLKNPHIKTDDPPNPNDCYGVTKLMAENVIKDSRIPYTILRLSYCASIKSLKFDPVMFRMPLETRLEIVHIDDAAIALVNALEKEEFEGKTYLIGGGKDCRIIFKDFLDDIMEILGFGRNFFPEEAFAKSGFNCGYCETKEIQSILKFQNKTLEDFYEDVREWIGIKRYFIPIVRWFVKKYLLRKSKYYKNSEKP